jgi:hypothetical protein
VKLQSPRPSSQPSGGSVSREVQELYSLSATIARARSGLVQELVEVFNVVEVGGRPPIGGKAGTKGEWTIGDLILPVPGDIRREFSFIPFCTIRSSKNCDSNVFFASAITPLGSDTDVPC